MKKKVFITEQEIDEKIGFEVFNAKQALKQEIQSGNFISVTGEGITVHSMSASLQQLAGLVDYLVKKHKNFIRFKKLNKIKGVG